MPTHPRPTFPGFLPTRAPAWARAYRAGDFPPYAYTADVIALTMNPARQTLEGLLVERARPPFEAMDAWAGGFVEWLTDHDARMAAGRELAEETGYTKPARHLETLDTYDANGRDPRQYAGFMEGDTWTGTGVRVVSKAFLAILDRVERVAPRLGEDARRAMWRNVYDYLPWEDVRSSVGQAARTECYALLQDRWVSTPRQAAQQRHRLARVDAAFGGATGRQWNEERAPERFALLMEAGLVLEAHRDPWGTLMDSATKARPHDRALAFDHRRMLADALGRVRGKLKYVPAVLAAFLEADLTIPELHGTCEAIAGRPIHLPNFRRAFTQTHALVIPAARRLARTPRPNTTVADRSVGRQATPYQWAPGVEARRLDPAIRMPWAPFAIAKPATRIRRRTE